MFGDTGRWVSVFKAGTPFIRNSHQVKDGELAGHIEIQYRYMLFIMKSYQVSNHSQNPRELRWKHHTSKFVASCIARNPVLSMDGKKFRNIKNPSFINSQMCDVIELKIVEILVVLIYLNKQQSVKIGWLQIQQYQSNTVVCDVWKVRLKQNGLFIFSMPLLLAYCTFNSGRIQEKEGYDDNFNFWK